VSKVLGLIEGLSFKMQPFLLGKSKH